jgi:hypothetical protein
MASLWSYFGADGSKQSNGDVTVMRAERPQSAPSTPKGEGQGQVQPRAQPSKLPTQEVGNSGRQLNGQPSAERPSQSQQLKAAEPSQQFRAEPSQPLRQSASSSSIAQVTERSSQPQQLRGAEPPSQQPPRQSASSSSIAQVAERPSQPQPPSAQPQPQLQTGSTRQPAQTLPSQAGRSVQAAKAPPQAPAQPTTTSSATRQQGPPPTHASIPKAKEDNSTPFEDNSPSKGSEVTPLNPGKVGDGGPKDSPRLGLDSNDSTPTKDFGAGKLGIGDGGGGKFSNEQIMEFIKSRFKEYEDLQQRYWKLEEEHRQLQDALKREKELTAKLNHDVEDLNVKMMTILMNVTNLNKQGEEHTTKRKTNYG